MNARWIGGSPSRPVIGAFDEGDELDPFAVEQVGEPAVESLGGQGHVADDPVPLGLEHDALSPGLGAHG